METEQKQGDSRQPTADEIAFIVRMTRDQRHLKRAALAADANLTDKTLERLEKGESMSETNVSPGGESVGPIRDRLYRSPLLSLHGGAPGG